MFITQLCKSLFAKIILMMKCSTTFLYLSLFAGDQTPEYSLLMQYHDKLLKILPVCDLTPYFVSEKVISLADNEEVLKSSTTLTAAQLILDRVSFRIKNGNTNLLAKMILIMEHYGIDAAKILSHEIKIKLKEMKHVDCKLDGSKYQGT